MLPVHNWRKGKPGWSATAHTPVHTSQPEKVSRPNRVAGQRVFQFWFHFSELCSQRYHSSFSYSSLSNSLKSDEGVPFPIFHSLPHQEGMACLGTGAPAAQRVGYSPSFMTAVGPKNVSLRWIRFFLFLRVSPSSSPCILPWGCVSRVLKWTSSTWVADCLFTVLLSYDCGWPGTKQLLGTSDLC